MWIDFVRALALLLVLEGILPFALPSRWRENLLRVSDDALPSRFPVRRMLTSVLWRHAERRRPIAEFAKKRSRTSKHPTDVPRYKSYAGLKAAPGGGTCNLNVGMVTLCEAL